MLLAAAERKPDRRWENQTLEHVREATSPAHTMHGLCQACLRAHDTHSNFQHIFMRVALFSE